MLGTVAGAYVGVVTAHLSADSNLLGLILLFVVSSSGAYLYFTGRHPYFWKLGLTTFYLVFITAAPRPDGRVQVCVQK